jgi:hypothetical protein
MMITTDVEGRVRVLRSVGKIDTRDPRRGAGAAHCAFLQMPLTVFSSYQSQGELRLRQTLDPACDANCVGEARNFGPLAVLASIPRVRPQTGDPPGPGGVRVTDRWTPSLVFSGCHSSRPSTTEPHPRASSSAGAGCLKSVWFSSPGRPGLRDRSGSRANDRRDRALTPQPGAVKVFFTLILYQTRRGCGVAYPTPPLSSEKGPSDELVQVFSSY